MLLCLLPLAATAATLRVEPEGPAVTMGRDLDVRVTFRGPADPGFVDYRAWREDFLTERLDRQVEKINGGVRVVEDLRVFPRREGRHKFHSLVHGGARSPPVAVTVRPAVVAGVDGTPRWRPLPESAWVGEALEMAVTVPKFHPGNEVLARPFDPAGFSVRELEPEQRTAGDHQEVILRWQLFPRRHGIHRIEPPGIIQRGRGRWRFHLPARQLEVRPLPSYLPESVPVGAIAMTSEVVGTTGAMRYRVTVTNRGRLPDEVYGLRTSLARIGGVDVEDVTLAVKAGPEGAAHQVYSVSLPRWSWGLGTGPVLVVPYFDPVQGMPAERVHRLPARWRLPGPAAWLLGLAAAAVAALGARALVRLWRRGRCGRAIREAQEPDVLRRLLLAAGGHRTLRDWAAASGDAAAERLAGELNRLCFSERGGALPAGMGAVAARLNRGRPRRVASSHTRRRVPPT